MKTRIIVSLLSGILFIASCGTEKKAESSADVSYKHEEMAMADSTIPADAYTQSSASKDDPKSNRKFIRNADLKFKVADARKSTYAIEDIIGRNGGFVTSTQLRAENTWSRNIPISHDSIVTLTTYSLVNEMEFRVPVSQLDSTLRQIGRQAEFMDYRTITANDVTQQLMMHELSQKRIKKQNKRLESHQQNRGGDILEATTAEERLMDQETNLDYLTLSQNGLQDDIAFSTVHLYFYQKETTLKEISPAPENIDSYQPGFFTQAGERIADGWKIGKAFLLFLLNSWFIIAIALGLWIGYRTFIQKKK